MIVESILALFFVEPGLYGSASSINFFFLPVSHNSILRRITYEDTLHSGNL